jgi:hypothetical protein
MAARIPHAYGPAPRHCDQCATDLPGPYVVGIVQNENICVCSGACVATLQRVWAPTHRHWRGWRVLPALAAAIILYLGR